MPLLKKLSGFAILFVAAEVLAQDPAQQLILADSLFAQKKFTQAFQTYQTLEQQGHRSDAMLLRMAYIQEGLNNTAESLLYLNRYWASTGDVQVLEKIQDVARKKNLSGYDYPATERVGQWLAHHEVSLALGASAALAAFVFTSFFLTRPGSTARRWLASASLVASLGSAYMLTQVHAPAFGISKSMAYLMQGPSAGAPVIARIAAGHRLPMRGKKDVWLKTEWAGDAAYIRFSNVQLLN